MKVHIVCGYRSKSDDWTEKWSKDDFRARNLVKGVKREPFGGFSIWTTTSSPPRELKVESTPGGQMTALRVAAVLLKNRLLAAGIDQAAIVPVPSSQHVVLGAEFTGSRIAAALQAVHAGFKPKPVLRFATPQPKTHDEGTRNPDLILPHIRSGGLTGLNSAVLLDDVMTTGGHLRAARRYLASKGIQVTAAVVIGRTVWQRPDNMFDLAPEILQA